MPKVAWIQMLEESVLEVKIFPNKHPYQIPIHRFPTETIHKNVLMSSDLFLYFVLVKHSELFTDFSCTVVCISIKKSII